MANNRNSVVRNVETPIVVNEDNQESKMRCPNWITWWYKDECGITLSCILLVIAIIMICAMVPSSYYGVEYDEYGLDRDKLFNKMDYNTVYDNGYYFLGLNHEVIKFPRTFQFETFSGNQLPVFSKEGLEFNIQCSFQWRPIKSAIPEIHRQFRVTYRPQVINRVIATIKNTVTNFTTDDFVTKRDLIDDTISYAISDAVRSLGFDIGYANFQLDKPLLPDNVRIRFLTTQVQLVKNDEQALRQQQALVIQETNVLVANINSNATRLLTESTSTASRIIAEAQARAFNIINTAEQAGLYLLFTGMNITDSTAKALLKKIITIENTNNTKLYFGTNPVTTLNL